MDSPATALRFFTLAALTVAAACSATPPGLAAYDGGEVDAGPRFADAVLSTTVSNQSTSCTANLPDCDTGAPATGACGTNPAVGQPPAGRLPDAGFTLMQNDNIVLGFLCNGYIISHADAGDLVIASLPFPNGYAIVEESDDGSDFETLGILDGGPTQTFSLQNVPVNEARFLRITGQGSGVILDSVEAL